jgi:capsular exopolysaccharide synthesis family protein
MNMMDNEELRAIQESNQVRRYALKLLRRWPYIIASLLIGLLTGYAINRYATPIYQVNARISTKKFSGKSTSPIPGLVDASFFLSGLVEVYEEIPILRMPKRFEAALDKVDLRVRYFSQGLIKTSESANGYTFRVQIDSIVHDDYPYGLPIYVNHQDSENFQLKIDNNLRWRDEVKGKTFRFGENISLGSASFTIFNANGTTEEKDKFYFVFNRKSDLLNEYISKLSINWAMKGSAMLDLSIESETPEREVKFLKAYYKAVEEIGLLDKNETLDKTIAFIDQQMEMINDSIVFYQELMDGMKIDNRKLSGGSEFIFSRLSELDKQRAEITLKESYYDYLTKYFNSKSEGDVFAPSLLGLDIPPLEDWVNRYVERKLTEKQMRNQENVLNPLVNRQDSLKRKLEAGIFEAMRSARERNQIQLANLKRQENEIFESVQDLQADFREISRFQRLYEMNQSLYDLLIRRKIEVAISKASATSDYHIINEPKYSRTPISPNENMNLLIAGFLGLFLPIGFFLMKDITSKRVVDKDDLQSYTVMPLLGNVAHSTFKSKMVVADHPRSVAAESFRSVRANLKFISGAEKNRTRIFIITSSIGGEGKTFCSLNLAYTLAMSGKKTLLIGADMRKPELGNYTGAKARQGLSEYLAGFAQLEEVILAGGEDKPDMIDAGRIPPNPSELLGSERMEQMMAEIKQRYDYVIVDTPPIGLVSDAMELFKYSDYNILIVRQGQTHKAALKMVNELYIDGKLSNFSVLFNDIELIKNPNSYYGAYTYGIGYSGYGYGYYEEDQGKKRRRK